MLTSLRKQLWFVFLMVFAIGWSSVALASVKSMHQPMMNAASVDQHHNAEMTVMSGCHDSISTQAHMQQHPAEHVKAAHDQDCHQTMTDHTQHFSCNDCVQLHCQSLTTWLDSAIAELPNLGPIQEHPQRNFDYSAQHLNGFWQQILRPPKA